MRRFHPNVVYPHHDATIARTFCGSSAPPRAPSTVSQALSDRFGASVDVRIAGRQPGGLATAIADARARVAEMTSSEIAPRLAILASPASDAGHRAVPAQQRVRPRL